MFLLPDLTSVVHLQHVGKCETLHVGKQREPSTQEPGEDSDPGQRDMPGGQYARGSGSSSRGGNVHSVHSQDPK